MFQVDSVKSSVDSTHAITTLISQQLVGPITAATTALQIMTRAKTVVEDEKRVRG